MSEENKIALPANLPAAQLVYEAMNVIADMLRNGDSSTRYEAAKLILEYYKR